MRESIITSEQPSSRHKVLTAFTSLAIFGVVISTGALWLGGPGHNLWSIRYLWQQMDHPLAALLPASARDDVPAEHLNGHVWQARTLLAAGQLLQAEAMLQPALAQGNYDAQRLQTEILAARGEIAGAVQILAQLAAVDDILVMARQAAQKSQPETAAYAYRTAYALAPERTVLPLTQFLRQEADDVAGAETLLRDYIATMPTSRYAVSWLRELGTLYREQKAWDKAIAIYTQLVAALPDSTGDRVQLGWLAYERGDGTEAAMTAFQQAVDIAPQEGAGYYAIGTLLSREKQYQEADPWYAQAIEREPEQQWWWLSRASALQQAGKLPAAIQIYVAMQQQFPDFAPGHYQAAWAYRQAEQREQAVAAIEQALTLLESNGISQEQASYYARAGQVYEWAGQLQQAVKVYERAEQLDPFRQDVQNGLQRLK